MPAQEGAPRLGPGALEAAQAIGNEVGAQIVACAGLDLAGQLERVVWRRRWAGRARARSRGPDAGPMALEQQQLLRRAVIAAARDVGLGGEPARARAARTDGGHELFLAHGPGVQERVAHEQDAQHSRWLRHAFARQLGSAEALGVQAKRKGPALVEVHALERGSRRVAQVGIDRPRPDEDGRLAGRAYDHLQRQEGDQHAGSGEDRSGVASGHERRRGFDGNACAARDGVELPTPYRRVAG